MDNISNKGVFKPRGMPKKAKEKKMNNEVLVPIERIEERIFLIRGQKVMLDADLAVLYGVTTKQLNQQVKRNKKRFPKDFAFQLTKSEKEEVVTKCDHLYKLKFSPVLPFAFTEHGAIMAASVINSQQAAEVSIFVVRAFVKLRQALANYKELAHKLDELERKYDAHDVQIKAVFEAIKQLMSPTKKPKNPIGFKASKN